MAIDQEKAFDQVDHKFLLKTLRHVGIPDSFTKWVEIMYHDLTCQIKNKGYLSAMVHISRGLRQGCPMSQLLYVVCAEVLAVQIREDQNIKGINLAGIEIKSPNTPMIPRSSLKIFSQ